ncbi:ribose 5-phosphate isomerase B [Rhodothalassium salexigens]|uniref:ribose 5-phosphate isomerase B n=1 Tax=Rhodothalassium salexigens TaxID=1086 RepID=UPI0019127124|nr:ribose 5-phosphate isomerase B [Rhodothalassium salexigens]MBK5920058.1 ribose 5-phosphate isomerase B [Rhodothalassium salexigens]
MTKPSIAMAADHAGVTLKNMLADHLRHAGYPVEDLGTHDGESVDYPDYGRALADHVATGKAQFGVAVCGSGIGISIAANRNPAVRAALVSTAEAAELARQHNDANILALGARLIDPETARACLDRFLATAFEGGRHARRVDKLAGTP